MKNSIYVLAIFVLGFGVLGCKKTGSNTGVNVNPASPTITTSDASNINLTMRAARRPAAAARGVARSRGSSKGRSLRARVEFPLLTACDRWPPQPLSAQLVAASPSNGDERSCAHQGLNQPRLWAGMASRAVRPRLSLHARVETVPDGGQSRRRARREPRVAPPARRQGRTATA